MIGNIIEYVHSYGFFDFEALPFSAVDALVLAQFVYIKIDGLVDGVKADSRPVTLKEMAQHPEAERLFADTRFEENNRALFYAMCESKRFGEMKCLYCADYICVENETQFMAVTCILSDGSVKVLYRGTDETIIGWKEDFNMAFQYPIPGQQSGRRYLERVAGYISADFDLIGHSKGGNLAVYAAMHASDKVQQRIQHIYNLDGPGFRTEVYSMGYFEKIADRIVKIIPRSSIVGMILENHGEYKVVDSKSIGFLQHDPYSWLIDRIDFVYVEQMDKTHRIMDESLNAWVMSLSTEEVSEFVNTLFQIVSASEATDLISFTKNWTKSLAGMAGAIQNLDEETKNNMYSIMKRLASVSRERIREEAGSFFQNKIEGLTGQLIGKEGPK
ncbi:MAG: DUF2974 domain-containing protein [Lachnospiraceae bacterium]|nr:DUF2974 domain-containing protein [Lachnospiraceae bacterium]